MSGRALRPMAAGILVSLGLFGLSLGSSCRQQGAEQPVAAPAGATALACTEHAGCPGTQVCADQVCVDFLSEKEEKERAAGVASLALVQAVASHPKCVELPGVTKQLEALNGSAVALEELSAELGEESGRPPRKALASWVLGVALNQLKCGVKTDLSQLAEQAGSVGEDEVERAAMKPACSAMMTIDELNLWPFENQLLDEITTREFESAAITVETWQDTFEAYARVCKPRMERRARSATRKKLAGIRSLVGYGDESIVKLRVKLLLAIEEGRSKQIVDLSKEIMAKEEALAPKLVTHHQARAKVAADLAAAAKSKARGGKKPSLEERVAAKAKFRGLVRRYLALGDD